MSTQGSVKGCQISVLLWGGSVCIQTGWGIGNVRRMEPGSRNWVPTTLVLVPLWDVTVGELRLFSGITEILAEIERNWKCGWRILSRVMRAQRWHTHRHTHSYTHTYAYVQVNANIYLRKHLATTGILMMLMLVWKKSIQTVCKLLLHCQLDQIENILSFFYFDSFSQLDNKCKTALEHGSAASTLFDACLHSINHSCVSVF